MYRICKTLDIENGHMLSKHPDKCRFPHGHSRRVEVILEAPELDENGMVCDFKLVRDAALAVVDRYDHALCVNTQDPMFSTLVEAYGERIIAFEDTEPTTETLARTFFEAIAAALEQQSGEKSGRYPLRVSVRLVRVRVWETATSWAEYEAN